MNLKTAKKIVKKAGVHCLIDDQPLAQLYRWARDDASDKDLEHLQWWTHWNLGIYSGFSHGGKASTLCHQLCSR